MRNVNNLLVKKDATIKEAMSAIDKGDLKTALVIDENDRFCGVVVDGDVRRGILKGIDIQEKVSEIMSKDPLFAYLDTSREEIINLFKKKDIFGLPLLDKEKRVKDFVVLSEGTKLNYLNKTPNIKKHLGRILVIGGAGYIGSILVRKLLDKGYSVNVLDNFTYGENSLKDIASNPKLIIIKGDTRHVEDITKSIRDVDAVVHLAELVGDPACALNPSTTQEINYLATKMVASICKHFQINRLVYASSCSVYGASKEKLLTEESTLNPLSLYAKMKIASEKALFELEDENFLPTILRLGTVFGFSHRLRFDLVVNLLTAKAMKDNKITIFGGNQWRPNVHVEDVADTIISILEAPIEKVGGHIFNVGSEENNHTINEIGNLIKNKISSAQLIVEESQEDKRDYKVNFTKLRNILGINMKKKVSDGINEIKEHFEKNKEIDYKDKIYSNFKFLEDQTN